MVTEAPRSTTTGRVNSKLTSANVREVDVITRNFNGDSVSGYSTISSSTNQVQVDISTINTCANLIGSVSVNISVYKPWDVRQSTEIVSTTIGVNNITRTTRSRSRVRLYNQGLSFRSNSGGVSIVPAMLIQASPAPRGGSVNTGMVELSVKSTVSIKFNGMTMLSMIAELRRSADQRGLRWQAGIVASSPMLFVISRVLALRLPTPRSVGPMGTQLVPSKTRNWFRVVFHQVSPVSGSAGRIRTREDRETK